MRKMSMLVLLLMVMLVLTGCASQTSPESDTAQKIVVDYYTALNNKDYQIMYGLISEGFKQIEPTAATYAEFETYMGKFFDTANGIRVQSTKISSATSREVVVDYVAVMELKDGTTKDIKSSFTIKEKPEGWRLIHPYGENIDKT